MDQFFTSLNKRQTMLLLTATTFGGQEGVAALDFLPEDQAELLKHRAQEILQIPREKRVPALVQEIKRLVKDRRGMLWSADPTKLAELLKQERGALVEVVLRALPAALAEAVRAHLPPTGVKLTREVRPQVLDIVRWKLEEMLARDGNGTVGFRFTDVLMMPTRELLTVCDRLGARVLGPAMAGLPDEEREKLLGALTPDLKQLATKSVAANAPRKLAEEDARAVLEVHEGLADLGIAIRSAGVQRLARACAAQSGEFAARMLERHRGDFGQLLARWVREERGKPPPKGDGGRMDIVNDLERLASRGYIERPMRIPQMPAKPAAPAAPARSPSAMAHPAAREPSIVREPAARDPSVREPVAREPVAREPVAREPAAPAPRIPALPQAGRAGVLPPPPRRPALGEARREAPSGMVDASGRRDPIAERAARRAGALSARAVERPPALSEGAADGSRMHRAPARREASAVEPPPAAREGSAIRKEPSVFAPIPVLREPRPAPEAQGSRVSPAPAQDGSRMGAAPARDGSRMGPPPAQDGSRMGPAPSRDASRAGSSPVREMPRVNLPPPREGSQVSVSRPRARDEGREASVSRSVPPRLEGSSVRVPPRPAERPGADAEASRVLSSSASRSGSRPVSRSQSEEAERPPRVVAGRSMTSTSMPAVNAKGEGTVIQRRPKPTTPGTPGRGPRDGTR